MRVASQSLTGIYPNEQSVIPVLVIIHEISYRQNTNCNFPLLMFATGQMPLSSRMS